ncbi:MAG: hypothetical protein GXP22_00130 [Gammaproteobacteria bacterium]|nr:hypothetical protein [Gammaproteobacteria bacterium]
MMNMMKFILAVCVIAPGILLADPPLVSPIVYIPLGLANQVVAVDAPKNTQVPRDGRYASGSDLFVSSKKDDSLVVIDTQTGVKRRVSLSPAPENLNAIRGTAKVYMSDRKEPIVWEVDQKDSRPLETIPLPAGDGHQTAVVE